MTIAKMDEFCVDPTCGWLEVRHSLTDMCVPCSYICLHLPVPCAQYCQDYTKEHKEKEMLQHGSREEVHNWAVDINLHIAGLVFMTVFAVAAILAGAGILYLIKRKRNPLLPDLNDDEPLLSPPPASGNLSTVAVDNEPQSVSGYEKGSPQLAASEQTYQGTRLQSAAYGQTHQGASPQLAASGQLHQGEGPLPLYDSSLQSSLASSQPVSQGPFSVTVQRGIETVNVDEPTCNMNMFSQYNDQTNQGEYRTPIEISLTSGWIQKVE